MRAIVNKQAKDHYPSSNAEEVATFPFRDWYHGLEALNCTTIIEKPREYPEADSKYGHEEVSYPADSN